MVLVVPGDTNAHKKRLVGVNREVQFQMCFPLECCDSRFEVLNINEKSVQNHGNPEQ